MKLGYALSSEEHPPSTLVDNARRAEEAGFEFAMVSDHYHPWTDRQGNSPFVWSVLGGIASTTERLRLGTGVTCPTVRVHPAIIAQAAATTAAMMPGRFFLGVGTGENLNEHILGDAWPSLDDRQGMLVEAIEIMRELWSGEELEYAGSFFTVREARLYTLPPEPPAIYVAAAGPSSARIAAAHGDGLIGTAPDPDITETYRDENAAPGPIYGQLTVCWAASVEDARKTAFEWWPNAAITGELGAELPLPRHFEQAAKMVSAEDVAKQIICGPDPEPIIEKLKEYARAGYDHLYLHQVGPDQRGFLDFAQRELLAAVQELAA